MDQVQAIGVKDFDPSVISQLIDVIKQDNDFVVSLQDAITMTTISKSVMYSMITRGLFPKQIDNGWRKGGFRNSDLQEYIKMGGAAPWLAMHGNQDQKDAEATRLNELNV